MFYLDYDNTVWVNDEVTHIHRSDGKTISLPKGKQGLGIASYFNELIKHEGKETDFKDINININTARTRLINILTLEANIDFSDKPKDIGKKLVITTTSKKRNSPKIENRTKYTLYLPPQDTYYYKKLWGNHVKGHSKNRRMQPNELDLIDYYASPTFTDEHNEGYSINNNSNLFFTADVGYGKSTLLSILLLCIIKDRAFQDPAINLGKQNNRYSKLKKSLLGDIDTNNIFPVYIHSTEANVNDYDSLIELADCYDEKLNNMIAEAYDSDQKQLLFLIDSFDEVDTNNTDKFWKAFNKLTSDYPNAKFYCTGRFIDHSRISTNFENNHKEIHINKLSEENIKFIIDACFPNNAGKELLSRIAGNRSLREFVRNPLNLMITLGDIHQENLHKILETAVDTTINSRWKEEYDVEPEVLKCLLGELAWNSILDSSSTTIMDNKHIRSRFSKALTILDYYNVYDTKDYKNQINSFAIHHLYSLSGVLNIQRRIQNDVEYSFQDDLICLWLAAFFIKTLFNSFGDNAPIQDPDKEQENIDWLGTLIERIQKEFTDSSDTTLSSSVTKTLIMTLVMLEGSDLGCYQPVIFKYLVNRMNESKCNDERETILNCLDLIRDNEYGTNDINTITEDFFNLEINKR